MKMPEKWSSIVHLQEKKEKEKKKKGLKVYGLCAVENFDSCERPAK